MSSLRHLASRAAAPSSSRFHQLTRRAHARELAEDYVEVIAALGEREGEARAADIAREMGVTQVTVSRALRRLERDGWVRRRPYRAVFLTARGRRLAAQARARHTLVVEFLVALGVPKEVARADAEGIEHHVSPRTLAAFARYVAASRGSTAPAPRAKLAGS